MFDEGSGPPVIVVPGIQGRWEWMKPALVEMRKRCRTVSYTLAGDIGSRTKFDAARGFDCLVRQLDDVFTRTGVERAAICGVSYGGFIAVRYAAARPERVSALVLASAPAPGWVPNALQQKYINRPWLSAPAFVATGPLRLWPEIRSALPSWTGRVRFSLRHAARIAAHPALPPMMAARVTSQQRCDFLPDCARVTAPTLVITGEPHLDRVVPVEVTRRYLSLIPGARYEMMEGTGHIGIVTRPKLFAELVCGFVHANSH